MMMWEYNKVFLTGQLGFLITIIVMKCSLVLCRKHVDAAVRGLNLFWNHRILGDMEIRSTLENLWRKIE